MLCIKRYLYCAVLCNAVAESVPIHPLSATLPASSAVDIPTPIHPWITGISTLCFHIVSLCHICSQACSIFSMDMV